MSAGDDDELFYRPKRHKSDNEQPSSLPSSFLPPHVSTVTASTSQYAPPPLDSISIGEPNWNVGQDFQNNASTSAPTIPSPGKRNYNGESLYDRLNALAIPFTRKQKPKNNANSNKSNHNQQYNTSYPLPSTSTQPSYHDEENWDGDPNIPLNAPPPPPNNSNPPPLPPAHEYQPPPPPPPLMPSNDFQPPIPPHEYQNIPPLMSPQEYQHIPPLMSPQEYPAIPPLMSTHDFPQQHQQQHDHPDYSRNRNGKNMNMNIWKMQNNIHPSAPIPTSCSLCMKQFKNRKLIKLHLKDVHGITRDMNNYMRFIDEAVSKPYQNHESTNSTCSNNSSSGSGGRIIACRFRNCGQQCMDFNELRDHYEMYHMNASSFYCLAPFCKNQFSTLMELDLHFSKIHPNAIDYLDRSQPSFQCQKSKCHRSFPTLELLKNHRQLAHKTSFPYYCHSDKSCNAEFHTRDKLDVHIREFHPQAHPDYEDEMNHGDANMDMGPNFNNRNMNMNINNRNREENWEDPDFGSGNFIMSNNDDPSLMDEDNLLSCNIRRCPEKFPTPELLSHHLTTVHEAKHKCSACYRQFTSEVGVQSHFQAKHSNLKAPVPQKLPPKIINPPQITAPNKNKNNSNNSKNNSNNNNNNSSTIRPLLPNMDKFPCQDQKCPAVFRSLIHMKNHYQLQHKSKGRFNCCSGRNCIAYFYTGVELELHLKTVHPKEYPVDISKSSSSFEIKCDIEACSYVSKTEEESEEHQRLHKGDSLDYKCEKEGCGVAFIKKQILVRHMRIIHKENNEATNKVKVHENKVSAPVSIPIPISDQLSVQNSIPEKSHQPNSSPQKLHAQNSSPEKFLRQNSSPEKFQRRNSTSEANSITSPTAMPSQPIVVVKQENEKIDDGDGGSRVETLNQEIKIEVKEELSEEEEGEVRDEYEGVKGEEQEEEKIGSKEEEMEKQEEEETGSKDEEIEKQQEEEKESKCEGDKDKEIEKGIKVEVENAEQNQIENNANVNNNTDTNDNANDNNSSS